MTGPARARPPAARIARNTTLRATADIISKLAAVAFFVVLARSFSTSSLGDWVFAMAVTQLLWPVAGFGLDRVLVREVSRDRSALDRLFYPTVWLKIAGNLVGLTVALGLLFALDYSDSVLTLVLVMGLSQCVSMAMTTAFSVFQAHEQMEYFFLASVPKGILSSLVQIAVILAGGRPGRRGADREPLSTFWARRSPFRSCTAGSRLPASPFARARGQGSM